MTQVMQCSHHANTHLNRQKQPRFCTVYFPECILEVGDQLSKREGGRHADKERVAEKTQEERGGRKDAQVYVHVWHVQYTIQMHFPFVFGWGEGEIKLK